MKQLSIFRSNSYAALLLAFVLFGSVRGNAQTSTTFNYSGSITNYTVPGGVTSLQLAAYGAQGGSSSGGQGAIMVGTFNVVPGHVLNILVGGQGGFGLYNGGGGGGSFIWDVTAGNTLLIAAGGGGGGRPSCWGASGSNASTTTTPTPGGAVGSGAGGSGGLGGAAGTMSTGLADGGGGCGWSGNGANGTGGSEGFGGGGLSPLNGGSGGAAGTFGDGATGGFGGGGGSAGDCGACGGGGGYNGGGGGNDWTGSQWGTGGGGGSFNGGISQSNSVGNNLNGMVIISLLTPPLVFNGGSTQSFNVCQNSGSNSINSLLAATDGSTGLTMTWSALSGPTHGTLSGVSSYTATSTGSSVVPTGMTYTPTSGYSGADAFTVQVTDGTSTTTTTVNVTVNALPTISAGSNVAICPGNNTTLTGSGAGVGGNYTWSPSTSLSATTGSSITANPTSTITYTVNGTTSAGCSSTASVQVSTNPVPSVSVTAAATTICSATTTTVNATGATTYTWSPATALSATTGSSVRANPSSTITYTVTGTNTFACSAQATVTINTLPLPLAIAGTPIVCVNANTALTDPTTGGTWSSSNIALATAGTLTGTLTGYSAGNPTITYTAPDGCIATIIATINALPVSTFTTTTNPICSGAAVSLNASVTGAVTYNWAFGDGGTGSGTSVSHTYTASGTFTPTLTVTNSSSCVSSSNLHLTVNPTPVAITGPAALCAGQSATFSDGTGTGHWTSSAIGTATAGSASGLVTGVAAGPVTISYTTAAGCSTSTLITINPLPAAIGSLTSICPGTTVTLTDAGGGTWASSNTAVGTIGSSTGTVGGITPGTTTITYTLPTGCLITALETVNPLPGPITGTLTLCTLANTTLGNSASGGTWTSISTGVATIGGTTGVVNGVGSGNSLISYTLPTGCVSTATVTVNPSPTLSGTTFLCTTTTTNLTPSITGGTWASSNSLMGSVNTSGMVTALSAGSPVITYTLPTGCMGTATMSINATPLAPAGSNNVCVNSTTTLSDATTGGTWSSSVPTTGSISASGAVTGVAAGNMVISYTVAGCSNTMNYTVNTTPSAITGGNTVCNSFTVTLNSTPAGGTWTSSNTVVGSVNASGIVTGLSTGATTIAYTLAAGGCKATNAVSVLATPVPISGSNNVCVGATTPLTDATSGGTWSSSASAASMGTSGIMSGSSAGTATITYTSALGCNAFLPVTVNPTPGAISGTSAICFGSTILFSDGTGGGTWSSSNSAVASVSSGGSVNGASTGTANISYTTNPGSCSVTFPVTINPVPASISGSAIVCTGLTTTLTDGTSGGTWSASNTNATIGSLTGIVTGGSSAGTVTMSYTLPTGCSATLPMSVNAQPATLTGTFNVCTTLTTTLGETTLGGTWSSTSPAIGSVNTSGTVTGITSGITTISYTLAGCAASAVVTVNPNPAAITGASVVCSTQTITLSDATSGGLWSSGAPATASVGSISGIVTGGTGGTTTITYTLAAGCSATRNITVNAMPTVYSITGGGAYCSGGTGLAIGLSGGDAGINYQLYNGPSTVGSPITGAGSSFSFGLQTAAGTYSVVATNPATGCTINMSGTTPIVINPLPNTYSVTGGGGYCSGGTGVHVGLNGSNIGINYQLYDNGTLVPSSLIAGTGVSLDYGLETTAGTYTVVAINPSTSCSVNMLSSKVVTVNLPPNAYTVTGGGGYCTSGSGVHIGTSTSDAGISYQLMRGGTNVGSAMGGTTSAIDFGLQTVTGTYSVFATNTATGCTGFMANTVTVTINPLPTVYAVTGTGGYCPGSAGSTISLANSASGVTYQLYLAGVPTGVTASGSGLPISFAPQTATGTYTVIATVNATTCTNTMSGSLVVSVNPAPTAYSVTGGGGYCTGTTTGVHVRLSGSSVGTTYFLYNGGTLTSTIPGTGSALDFGAYTAVGTYTVSATSSLTCPGIMTGSATVTINPLPNPYPMSASGGYCVGSGTGVDVQLTTSDAGVTYQLYNGSTRIGSVVSGSGSFIDFGPQTIGGVYSVVATVNATTCSGAMATTTTVNAYTAPTAYSVTGGGSFCTGGTGVPVGLSGSTAGVSYQLFNSSTGALGTIGGSGGSISFGLQTAPGTYTVVATNPLTSGSCTANMTGSAIVSVNALPTPYVLSAGGGYCPGSAGVTLTLSGSNNTTNYQLYYGSVTSGGVVAGTGSSLTFGPLTGVGTYTISATSTTTGCTGGMTGTATVSAYPLPTPQPVTGGGFYCAGGTGVPISITPTSAGVNYQLVRNGTINVGSAVTGGSTITYPLQTVAGSYTVVATNTVTSCSANMSGAVSVSINPLPTIYTVTGGGNYCAGSLTGSHVTLSGSQSGINYQLFDNTTSVGTFSGTGTGMDFGAETGLGSYTAIAKNPITTCTVNLAGAVSVSTNPLPTVYTVTGGGTYCVGGVGLSVVLSNTDAGINYQLYLGTTALGSPVAGITSSYSYIDETATGNYSVIATNAATHCSAAMTGTVNIATTSLPTPFAVTGGGNYCAGSSGSVVNLSGSLGGTNYDLYLNGTYTGTTVTGGGSGITFGSQTGVGTYTVMATGSGCSGPMTGSVTVSINPVPNTHTVTGGGNYCPGTSGSVVALDGSDPGMSYQLFNTDTAIGSAVPGSGGTLTFGAQTALGYYTVIATNATTHCTSLMNDSVAVNENMPPTAYTFSGPATYCAGSAGVTMTTIGSDAGTSYQLYIGATMVGSSVSGTGAGLTFGPMTATGIYTLVATDGTTLCSTTMPGADTVSISPLPAVYTVTGGGNYCSGSAAPSVMLSNSAHGIGYQLFNGTTPVGTSIHGTGSAINFGSEATAGAYTVLATDSITECTSNMSGSAIVGINPLPTTYMVTGGGGYCPGTPGVHVGISGSNTGISYQLLNGTAHAGSAVAGTGGAVDFGIISATGIYKVVATNIATTCTAQMTDSTIVTLNMPPVVYNVSGSAGSYCAGGTGVSIMLSNSDTTVNYALYRNGLATGSTLAGTGSSISFGPETLAGSYTITATGTALGCNSNMSGTATVYINPAPTAYNVIGGGNYCAGGTGVHIGLSNSQVAMQYQLYNGTGVGSPITGTGTAIDFGIYTAGGTYTILATNTTSGCTATMTGSATVNIEPLPIAYTVTGGGNYCAGGTGVAIGMAHSVAGINYQLYNGSTAGGIIPGTDSTATFGMITAAGTYSVMAINATTGCSAPMSGTVAVATYPLPAAFTVTGGGNICPGAAGVTIGLGGSGAGINYQLYVDTTAVGSPVAGTILLLNFGPQTAAGTYTVKATDATTGCTSMMTGSATVAYYPAPSAYSVTGGGIYCSGTSGTHIGLSNSTAGISYRLNNGTTYVGSAVIGTGSAIDFGPFITGTYHATATILSTGCSALMSDSAIITPVTSVVPAVTVSTIGGDTSCNGTATTFSTAVTNGGSTPSYSWTVNGHSVSGAASYTYSPANGDVVKVVVTSSAVCAIPATADNAITMTVLPVESPAVVVSANPGNVVCASTSVTFSALPSGSGTAPSFEWFVNSDSMGNTSSYTYIPTNGDVVYCKVTSSYRCSSAAYINSAPTNMEVDNPITPAVSMSENPGTHVANGQAVIFTASVTNGASPVSYQWFVNGNMQAGATADVFSPTTIHNLDSISCEVTTTGTCPGLAGDAHTTMYITNVGVNQINGNMADVTLVPNPNNGIFTVKGSLGISTDEDVTIEVTDMLGQTIYSNKSIAHAGTVNEKVQLSNTLANGMYMVSVHTDTGNIVFHMVVTR
jgi:PKD domain/Secretion system C-terminal sorting domain/Bacterial Ig-like domain (group 2)/Bacterial Ig domain